MADFVLYSYQCNPIHIEIDPKNPTLDPNINIEFNRTADANMRRHQEIVQEFFTLEGNIPLIKENENIFFQYNGSTCSARIVMNENNVVMLRMQKSKIHQYEKDFCLHKQKEEPSSMVIIDNRHEQQRILIERNANTYSTHTVAVILEKNIGAWLKKNYSLGFRVPLVYRKEEFWHVVEEHKNDIKKLTFRFPYPNMARTMNKLGASLKQFGADLHGKVSVTTQAQPKDVLVIQHKEENGNLDEIVSYLSEVGSPVEMYLVSGDKVKCCSKENPIVVSVKDLIANFRGEKGNELFPDNFFEKVTEVLNRLKDINYGDRQPRG